MANPKRLPRRSYGQGRDQRGIALIIVLWLVVLLAVMALGMGQESRTAALVIRNQLNLAKARKDEGKIRVRRQTRLQEMHA